MKRRPSVSVVIPSRGRPHLVPVVLNSLRYLSYPAFEVVLVGDAQSIDAYDLSPDLRSAVHYVPCAVANISAARNLGIRAARGELVAFIDDDAVPEPDWLDQLVMPFEDEQVGAAGGLVRDRDGVRCQFEGATFDRIGEETALPADERNARVWPPELSRLLAMMGTNCIFRRSALMSIGGFDESYRYYLDETDTLIRMAKAGWHAAWVPGAEVHHLSDQNGMRGRNREPRDPYQLGASKSYFGLQHTPESDREAALKQFRARMSRDLDHHIRIGTITGAERNYMIARLELGIQDGLSRQPQLPLIASSLTRVILPFPDRIPETRLSIAVLGGRSMAMLVKTEKFARGLVTRGHRVSLFVSRSGGQTRSVRFVDGLWIHEGPSISQRSGPAYRQISGVLGDRYAANEIERIDGRRRFDAVVRPCSWDQVFDRGEWHRVSLDSLDLKLGFQVLGHQVGATTANPDLIRREVVAAVVKDAPIKSVLQLTPRPTATHQTSATVSPG